MAKNLLKRSMKASVFSFLLCLVVSPFTFAQQLNGYVKDAEQGEPLAFANISARSSGKGTVANLSGQYLLDISGLSTDDSISFSYVGYELLTKSVTDLINSPNVALQPAAINLEAVQVLDRSLTAEEIITRVRENYDRNYPAMTDRKTVFFHKYDRSPYDKSNQLIIRKTDFVGIDENLFEEIMGQLPETFVEYQDAIVELYAKDERRKLVPVQGISLEESAMKDITTEFEKKLGNFFNDIEETMLDDEIYYKFRTGIFAQKVGHKGEVDSTLIMDRNDSLNYVMDIRYVKGSLMYLIKQYANIESKNWQFINKPSKYQYNLGEITVLDNQLVYPIDFLAQKSGLFNGKMYVSARDYAVLQMDYEFAPGRQTEKFQLLGIGHSIDFRKARVSFAKSSVGYYPKYINAEQKERASIDRKFSVMKKQKRFLWDKELNEIKMEAHMKFDTESFWEMLVLDHEVISSETYEEVNQPKVMRFRKEYAYSPDMWKNKTVIAPSEELKQYQRQVEK